MEVLVLEKIRESAVQLTILLNIAVLLFLPVKILYRENPPVEVPVWKQSVKVEYSSSYYYMVSYPFAPPIAASMIVPANNKEKTPRNIPVWEKIRQSLPLLI